MMPARRRRALSILPLLAALVVGVAAPAAHANGTQISVMMDDNQLLYRSDKTRDNALLQMKALGVDDVRATVLWSVVANGARSTKKLDQRFGKLGAANPKAYPRLNWNRYDGLVRTAQAYGIGVYFDITGPGPSWGHARAPRSERANQATWMPKAREFKLFVEAVGKRYSGTYRDEDTGHSKLPRVSFWSLWNEPNQGGWLTPQWYHGKAYSPMMYRRLYIAGYQGLVATRHASDIILLGETAPLGSSSRTERSPMYPKTFLENLFCVDANGVRVHDLGCSDFTTNGPLVASAYAHHPYTKHNAPDQKDKSPLAYTMANISDLTAFLDKIAAGTGRIRSGLPVALTEFGYETSPPDRFQGISLDKQAEYSNEGDFLAWANPRVIAQTQFLLRDAPPLTQYRKNTKHYWFTYQSGLYFQNGKAKPAMTAYRFPLEVLPFSRTEDGRPIDAFWGQLRFRPNNAVDHVLLQYQATGSKAWTTFGDPISTTARNFFVSAQAIPGPGKIRAAWGGPVSPYLAASRAVAVG
jgi:hypothetical protein